MKATTAARTTMAPANDPAAHALLRGAHEATYHYAPDFPGFRATIRYTLTGAAGTRATGTARMRSPRDLTLDIAADEADWQWLRQELGSMVGHRWHAPYGEGDGRYTQTLGPDDAHPYGRLIRIHDDRFDSSYRVRDGQIARIERRMGPLRFTIHIQDRVFIAGDREGRALPTHFTVAYWHVEQGRLVRTDIYRDAYVAVAGLQLPASRLVVTADDTGLTYRELRLTAHELLTGEDTATGGEGRAAAEHGRTRAW